MSAGDDDPIAAFDRVCTQLGGFDAALSTEFIEGYLTALAAGPRAVPVGEWLPQLCGEAFDRAFADPADVQRAMDALLGRCKAIAGELDPEALADDPDALRLRPVLMSPDEGDDPQLARWVGARWAEGFQRAIDDHAADWQPPPRADANAVAHFRNCVSIVGALTLDDDALAALQRRLYPKQQLERDDLVDEACFAVQELRMFWIDQTPRPQPLRVAAKPGRNDLCPCGSGRKYKRCHGA